MSTIHPTASIDAQAQIGDDVEIGPYCVIRGRVVLGDGCRLIGNVYLDGPITLGRGNTIYPFACLGFAAQDRKFDPALVGAGCVIGDDNIMRESFSVHRATGERPTTIGNRNYLMGHTHVGHDSQLGDDCTLANGALLAGHVQMQNQVIISALAAVHQFCRVGRLAMLSGLTGATQDVPPFCTVYRSHRVGSLNIVGLRRAGLRDHIDPLRRALDILYCRGLPNKRAVQVIQSELGDDPLCRELAAFVAATTRGMIGYEHVDEGAEAGSQ